MDISVVIPAYRASRTIQRAVSSVMKQTIPPSEILVIDDGSPDGDDLAAALRPYGSAVVLIQNPHGGAASARNRGIAHARCKWVAFLDADDFWEPEKLERQLTIIQRYPELGLVGSQWYMQEPGQPRTPRILGNLNFCDRLLRLKDREAFEVALVTSTCTLIIRRTALAAEQFDPGLETAEDRDLWIRLLSVHPAYILSDLLVTCVQEPNSLSRSNIDRDYSCMLRVIHRYAGLLGPSGLRKQEAELHRRWACVHNALAQPDRALPHVLHRLRRTPLAPRAWWQLLRIGAQATWVFCSQARGNKTLSELQ